MLSCSVLDLVCADLAQADLVNHSDWSAQAAGVFADRNLGRLVRSFVFD
jgi:hypothetical protein